MKEITLICHECYKYTTALTNGYCSKHSTSGQPYLTVELSESVLLKAPLNTSGIL